MTNEEFRSLQHGDKIKQRGCRAMIVHNNHKSGSGIVVAVRTEVIRTVDSEDWEIVRKFNPIKMSLPCGGVYEARIVRRIE